MQRLARTGAHLLPPATAARAAAVEPFDFTPAPFETEDGMGGVRATVEQLQAMQQSDDYILHGRRGELARVPAQKTALPLDPVGHTQRLELFRAPDGVIYAAQCSVLSRSEDEGRSWEHLTRTVAPGRAGEPPQMPDDHFLNMRVLPSGEWIRARTDNENGAERETASAADLTPSEVAISVSSDEGASWTECSRIGGGMAPGEARLGTLEVDGQGGVMVIVGFVSPPA